METFEYAMLCMAFPDYDVSHSKVSVVLYTFDSLGVQKAEVVNGETKLIPNSVIRGGSVMNSTEISEIMLPEVAKLGAIGWELVEYKFSSYEFPFAQAILKRRSQQQK